MTFDLNAAENVLARTPAVLRAQLEDLPETWLHADEGEGTFSPFGVLGHLVHGEKADWIPRSRQILDHGDFETFEPFDRFAHENDQREPTCGDLLEEFAELRAGNLATLRSWNLTSQQLATTGRHPAFGKVTLEELLATWVVHDLGHLAQIDRVMAKHVGDAVGPWREYLTVLGDRT